MAWAAVIAAGGKEEGSFADAMGSPHKALARFGTRTSLDRTLAALRESDCAAVAVVGPEEVREHAGSAVFVHEGDHAIENVGLGMLALSQHREFLLLPSDSPALDGSDLSRFMGRFVGGAAVSLTPLEDFKSAYPDVPAKAIRLREGQYLSGAPFAVDRESFASMAKVLAEFRERRKSPLAMIGRLGWGNLFRYALGRLSSEQAQRILSQFFQVSPIFIDREGHPGLALDFDSEEEFRLLQKYVN